MHTQGYVSSRRRSCSTSRRCARNYTSRRPFKAISPVTMSRWLQDAGSLRAQLGTWGPLVHPEQFRPTWTSARWWRRPTGQGWPPCRDIISSRNVSSRWLVFYTWPVKCTVVIILLLLWADQVFRCYCEQTLFSFATVSKLYCFFEILLSFWKHFLFLRETLQILILLALLSYQLV